VRVELLASSNLVSLDIEEMVSLTIYWIVVPDGNWMGKGGGGVNSTDLNLDLETG